MRHLGKEGPVSSDIGLGCMGMSQFYGPGDDAESIRTIHRALDLGVTLLDTADMYGPYTNELLIGRALRSRRDEALIATKFGNVKDGTGRVVRVDGSPEYVRRACEGSLRRLGVDVIDIYCQHRVDRTVPVEETWGALSALVSEGKVRYLAISEASAETIARAHAVHPVTAVQTEFSLVSRDPQRGLLALLDEWGIGFIAYAPLGRGLLSGVFDAQTRFPEEDFRSTLPRFGGENLRHNAELVDRVRQLARRHDVTVSQLALAWVLAQGPNIVPIPGTKRVDRLEQNLVAADLRLTDEELGRLDEVAPVGAAAGDRYPDMSHVDI